MFDDNFAAAARAAASAGGGDEDDDDYTLQHDSDKPGFVRWAEALISRHISTSAKCSIGYWDSVRDAVVLTQTKGKKQAVMGFSSNGKRCLHAEEALYLVDDGQLVLMAHHPETGEDLRPGVSRAVAAAPPEEGSNVTEGSTKIGMAIDDGRPHTTLTSVAVASVSATSAPGPPTKQPSWKSNDDLLEDLIANEDGEGDADGDEDDDGDCPDEEGESGDTGSVEDDSENSRSAGVKAADAVGVAAAAAAAAAPSASAPADPRAVHSDRELYLSLPAAYMFLLERVPLHRYLVYQHLRSLGLVALRHDQSASAAALHPRPVPDDVTDSTASSALTAASAAAPAAVPAPITAAAAVPETSLPPVHLLHKGGLDRRMFAPPREGEPQRANSSGFAPPATAAAAAAAVAPASSPPSSALPPSASRWVITREADVTPDYDVYARDGISAFKLSAPGPPDFYVCVQTADQPPPTPAQTTRLFARLAAHMASLRRIQILRGVLPLVAPSFSELGGGGGVSGAAHGRGGAFMSRVAVPMPTAVGSGATSGAGAGTAAGSSSSSSSTSSSDVDASAFSPNVKIAIVAHTAITLYTCTPVELRLPQRFVPRAGGPAQALTGGAAAMFGAGAAAAAAAEAVLTAASADGARAISAPGFP